MGRRRVDGLNEEVLRCINRWKGIRLQL